MNFKPNEMQSFILLSILSLTVSLLVYVLIHNHKLRYIISSQEHIFAAKMQQKDSVVAQYRQGKLDIYKRIFFLTMQKNRENDSLFQLYSVVFGTTDFLLNWDAFSSLIDEVHGNALSRLWKFHPNLSVDQVNFCCLILAGFTMPEISAILHIKGNSVRMKKWSIREKLGISGETDLYLFLIRFSEGEAIEKL